MRYELGTGKPPMESTWYDAPAADLAFERSATADGASRLAIAGEIDFSNVDQVRAAVTPILDESKLHRLVVDCERLKFIDSLGVQTLLTLKRVATERGIALTVANMRGMVRRVTETLGVAGTLEADAPA
jgi:anti-anti-sigma factor